MRKASILWFVLTVFLLNSCAVKQSSFLVKRKYTKGYYFTRNSNFKETHEKSFAKVDLKKDTHQQFNEYTQILSASSTNYPGNFELLESQTPVLTHEFKKVEQNTRVIKNRSNPQQLLIRNNLSANKIISRETISNKRNSSSFVGGGRWLAVLLYSIAGLMTGFGFTLIIFSWGNPDLILLGVLFLILGFLLSIIALRMGSGSGMINSF